MTVVDLQNSTDTPEAQRYNRIRRYLGIADVAVGLGVLLALLITGWTGTLRDIAYQGAHQNYVLAVFLYVAALMVISKIIGFGLDYYGFRLEHRFKLSNQRFSSWLWDEFKGWLVGLVLAVVLVEIVYYIIRASQQYWWLIAWAVFIGFFVLMAQIAPVVLFPIFYKFKPLQNQSLKDRLLRLSERAGTRVRGVYEWKLSEKSKKANAALTGLGKTRRIILADTLLEGYSEDEIEAVLAHELGHHVHRHILKSIGIQVAVTFVGFWAANEVLRYAVSHGQMFIGLSDFANLPLLILVSTILSLLLVPVLNAYSRHNEREADRYAFNSIASVEPFISSMNKLADQNLAERTPSKWVELLFHSHPPISKRITAAKAHGQRTRVLARR
ncbi:MAG TPA: M48 family metallopeptidase [Terriglobales bacterium]|nr:M48 family metallopeptidase [Terriglobales bacterium]